jgi:hypothetical protein
MAADFHPILYAFVNSDVKGEGTDQCNEIRISNSLLQRALSSLLTSRSARLLRLSTWLPLVCFLPLQMNNEVLTDGQTPTPTGCSPRTTTVPTR